MPLTRHDVPSKVISFLSSTTVSGRSHNFFARLPELLEVKLKLLNCPVMIHDGFQVVYGVVKKRDGWVGGKHRSRLLWVKQRGS